MLGNITVEGTINNYAKNSAPNLSSAQDGEESNLSAGSVYPRGAHPLFRSAGLETSARGIPGAYFATASAGKAGNREGRRGQKEYENEKDKVE